MKIEINEIAFMNDQNEYLDVEISQEGYITLDLETSKKFSMDEKDWKIFSRKINEIFKNMKKK
jgi:hypothetical protein